jgi:hypothetical protein
MARASAIWQRSGGQPRGEGLPLDELHDEERTPVRLADLMKRGDRRMRERRERASLAFRTARAGSGSLTTKSGKRL